MAEKRKADQPASPKKSRLDDTNTAAQRARLLTHLRKHGSLTTFEAIRLLNIVRPGSRISELRKAGHPIRTQRSPQLDDHGQPHRGVATYYLFADSTEV